jgi:hypothetical protein
MNQRKKAPMFTVPCSEATNEDQHSDNRPEARGQRSVLRRPTTGRVRSAVAGAIAEWLDVVAVSSGTLSAGAPHHE